MTTEGCSVTTEGCSVTTEGCSIGWSILEVLLALLPVSCVTLSSCVSKEIVLCLAVGFDELSATDCLDL